jgi:hypothetical protein
VLKVVALLLAASPAACTPTGTAPDAGHGVCVDQPGLHLILAFDPPGDGDAPTWSDPEPLVLTTTGAGTVRYEVSPAQVDSLRNVDLRIAWPPGTTDGDASIAFYASKDGVAEWQAEPQRFFVLALDLYCAEVYMPVHFAGTPEP